MITPEEYQQLLCADVQQAIRDNRHRDPAEVALDRHIPHPRLVATQVKYLRRAESKLPTYAAAQCILPSLAFEQSSSEECAAHKTISGGRVLDLTCGLGVDSLFLSRRFERVVSLERNPMLAEITRENFRRMSADNIEVINTSAEEYLSTTEEHFDWIYADPDRRSAEGRKLVRLEDCSPSIPELLPLIRKAGERLCVKNSPLFDVDEAFRLFPQSQVEVISLGGECKEVVIYDDHRTQPLLTATALGKGSFSHSPLTRELCSQAEFSPDDYRWLVIPDVALQKARLALTYFADKAEMWSENGFAFARQKPDAAMGRVLEIERIEPYDPKQLKRQLKGRKGEILKRDFPFAAEEIAKRTGLRPGNDLRLAFTKTDNRLWTIHLK